MDTNLILDVIDVEIIEVKQCRACLADLTDSPSYSMNEIGFDSLTFKQIFESSIGYEITESEFHNFCESCAELMTLWENFKNVCKNTQETLYPPPTTSIKLETIIQMETEQVWLSPVIKEEPVEVEMTKTDTQIEEKSTNEIKVSKSMKNVPPKVISFNFKVISRMYLNQTKKNCQKIGDLCFEATNLQEIEHRIWLFVKSHLKREIIFSSLVSYAKPEWHPKESPEETDLHKFILFRDEIGKKAYIAPVFLQYARFHNREITLYVYPYSRSVTTPRHMKLVDAVLINANPDFADSLMKFNKMLEETKVSRKKVLVMNLNRPVSPFRHLSVPAEAPKIQEELSPAPELEALNLFIPDDSTEYPYIFKFKACSRNFSNQRNTVVLGNFTIAGNDMNEVRHHLWIAVQPHIVREIVFKDSEPDWNAKQTPTEEDLTRFIDFSDRIGKRTFTLEHLHPKYTSKVVKLYVYPYSTSILNVDLWKKACVLINLPKKLEEEEEKVRKEFDKSQEIIILTKKLKDRHEISYPNACESDWQMWSHYIDCFSTTKHETLLNESPPTQMLPFFDKHLNLFPSVEPSDEPKKLSFEALILLKETKSHHSPIFLGKSSFEGDTITEITHSIWLKSRPFIVRGATVDEFGITTWSDNETPSEDDLSEFVLIVNRSTNQNFSIKKLTESLLERWKDKKNLSLHIYPFSHKISTNTELQALNHSLYDQSSLTWYATDELLRRLEKLNDHKLKALKISWRMWAHFIQSHDARERERLMSENPPKELQHLFVSLSDQEIWRNVLLDSDLEERKKESGVKPIPRFKLLQVTEEEWRDETKMKKCPFEGCSSVFRIKSYPIHYIRCKFNRERKITHKCPYEGCNKAYTYTSGLKNHSKTCRFNPNREGTPKRQCPYCPVQLTKLSLHIQTKHSDMKFICDICGEQRHSKAAVESHILHVHQNFTYQCEKCPSAFKTRKTLRTHIERDHSDKSLAFNVKCDMCTYRTYSKKNLLRHFKYKHDPNHQMSVCPVCQKELLSEKTLKKHMLTHADTKFNCEICNHLCKTEQGLKSHMTLHQEWKYECPVCKIKRRSAYEVRMHCKRKHPKYKLPPKGTVMKTTSHLMGLKFKNYDDKMEESD